MQDRELHRHFPKDGPDCAWIWLQKWLPMYADRLQLSGQDVDEVRQGIDEVLIRDRSFGAYSMHWNDDVDSQESHIHAERIGRAMEQSGILRCQRASRTVSEHERFSLRSLIRRLLRSDRGF
jgi:hypothetical protein